MARKQTNKISRSDSFLIPTYLPAPDVDVAPNQSELMTQSR